MSEISARIIEALQAGDPLTSRQKDQLNQNPGLLDELSFEERLEIKLAYGLDLTEADVQDFPKDPSLAIDVSEFAEAVFRAVRNGDVSREFFDAIYGDGKTAWRRGSEGLQDLPEPFYPAQTIRAGIGNIQRDDLELLVALSDLSPAQVEEGLDELANTYRLATLKDMFRGTEVPVNAAVDRWYEREVDKLLEENPERDPEATRRMLEAGEEEADPATLSDEEFANLSTDEKIAFYEDQFGVADPIGVGEDFSARRGGRGAVGGKSIVDGDVVEETARPRYGTDDIALDEGGRLWADRPLEVIIGMQADMVEAGYLQAGGFTVGMWDRSTREARFALLDDANNNLQSWHDTLQNRMAAPRDDQFVPEPFLAPDPASIASDVRNMFINNLGRLPTDIEMAELADELELNHRLDYEAQQADARAMAETFQDESVMAIRQAAESVDIPQTFGRQTREEKAGISDIVVPDVDVAIPDQQDVDPRSRLEQSFFNKYGPLIEYRRERSDAVEAKSNLMQSILNLDALMKQGTGV